MRLSVTSIDVLRRQQRDILIDRLANYLREYFPDAQQVPQSELRAGIDAQVTNAAKYGFEDEHKIATFVTASWLLGDDFDSRMPAAHAVLSSPLAPEKKRAWLEEFTRETFDRLRDE